MLSLIWLFVSVTPLPPNDLWWHMAAGRTMVAEGTLLDTNRWAYTLPGAAPYVYQSWLSEVLLYWLWRLGDVPLLALTRAVVITSSYALVAWHAWRRTGQGKAIALGLLLGAMIGWSNWTLRPQTLALLPGAAFVVVLGEYIDGRVSARWLAALPAIMVVWVNLHGSFVLGVGLLALACLGQAIDIARSSFSRGDQARRARMCIYAGLATLLAVLAQPLGPGIVGYVRAMLTNAPLQKWFVEWQPLRNDLDLVSTGFWFFLVLLLLAVLMASGSRRPSATDLLWYCGLAWLAISGVRYAIWFGLVLLPLLAERLALLFRTRAPMAGHPAFTLGLGALLCATMAAALPWFAPGRYLGPGAAHLFATAGQYRMLLSNTTPVGATEWLERNPIDGRFWADMSYTSYTIWELPDKQVFTDLRVELFPESIWLDYFAIARGDERSLALLDTWQITHLMLDRGVQESLHQLLARTPGWCERYRDSNTAIMARCR